MNYISILAILASIPLLACVDVHDNGNYTIDQWGAPIELGKAPHDIKRPRLWDNNDVWQLVKKLPDHD